jgi:hypothetical protein
MILEDASMHIHINDKLTWVLAGTTIVLSLLWHVPAEVVHFAREHFHPSASHPPVQVANNKPTDGKPDGTYGGYQPGTTFGGYGSADLLPKPLVDPGYTEYQYKGTTFGRSDGSADGACCGGDSSDTRPKAIAPAPKKKRANSASPSRTYNAAFTGGDWSSSGGPGDTSSTR